MRTGCRWAWRRDVWRRKNGVGLENGNGIVSEGGKTRYHHSRSPSRRTGYVVLLEKLASVEDTACSEPRTGRRGLCASQVSAQSCSSTEAATLVLKRETDKGHPTGLFS